MDLAFFNAVPQDVLDQLAELDFSLQSVGQQHEVNSLLERTVLLGGKRLRPLLTLLVGRMCGVELERLAPYARLIELLHAASLAHDDVIDNATMRRGQESINTVASNKHAVLAGDFLFAEVIVSATKEGNLALVQEVAHVIEQLSAGEWLQLEIAQNRDVNYELVEKVALNKTASVLMWCSIVGPYLLDNAQLIELARNFGRHLGLAFQLVDDTLDFSFTAQKDFMIDEENGVLNAVMVEWLSSDAKAYATFKESSGFQPDLNSTSFRDALQSVRKRAADHLKIARDYLDKMGSVLQAQGVRGDVYHQPLVLILDFLAKREF